MAGDDLGDRMKRYEDVNRHYLIRRTPVIIRVDGKAFHTLTKGMKRPWDEKFSDCMCRATVSLCNQLQGAKMAYTQSDEISILLTDYEKLETQAWFDNNIQKMVSIAASFATLAFNKAFAAYFAEKIAHIAVFDARAFNLPKEEVCNYFIWRQQDATRNSIQMLARSIYTHKELHEKNTSMLQEMCFQRGFNWDKCLTWQKRGFCVTKQTIIHREGQPENEVMVPETFWSPDYNIPVFTQDREYIEKFVR